MEYNDEVDANVKKLKVVRSASKVYPVIKRFMDILLSSIALFFLSPLLLFVGLAIKLEDNGTAIFYQERIGKDGKPFTMLKFRSMCMDAEEKLDKLKMLNERDGPAFKITDDPRVTKVGAFIRKTCIDELPQLVNIFIGDMSIVGPRPPLASEVAQYSDYHMQRLLVTPGLTCFWQVRKNKDTSFDEWVEMDLKYIKEQSLLTDVKLILSTIKVVIFRRGDD